MKVAYLALLAALLSGCATVFTDAKDQEIMIDSKQENLALYDHNKEFICDIPCKVKPNEVGSSGIFIVAGGGYKSEVLMIERKRNPATYGQLTLGIGEVIDGMTGANLIYEPYTLVELEDDTKQ